MGKRRKHWPPTSPELEAYVMVAQDFYQDEGLIEVEREVEVVKGGAYVKALIWVEEGEMRQCLYQGYKFGKEEDRHARK